MVLVPAPIAANPLPYRVQEALLDFEQRPGRYAVARREPALLFEQVGTVLQLASDRTVDGLSSGSEAQALETRRAARYFVRTVMLRPGTDHYTLLGLTSASPPVMLRDHYRMMIRLAHPDFATADEDWPADAASRINFANDVLCSPVQRHLYDASLMQASPVSTALRLKPPSQPAAKTAPWNLVGDGETRRWLIRRGPVAMSTLLLLASFWWLFSDPGHQGLLMVKRPPATPPEPPQSLAPQGMGLKLDTQTRSLAPGAAASVIGLGDVQPTMDQVLGALRSGRGETVLQVLNNEWRSHPSTTRFVDDFNQRLAGRTVRGLDEVKSSASSADGMFVVESAIDFQLLNALQQKETLRLNLKAVFLAQEGAPVLTQLVTQP